MCRRRSPSVMMPTSLPSRSVMPTQPKPFARHLDDRVRHRGAERRRAARLAPVCITSRTNLSFAPSRPPGCKPRKSSAVKPRLSSSATASASPSASCISEDVVGARLCGQASRACGSSSTTSAAFASVLVALRRHGDQADAEAARIVDQVLELDRLARPGQRHDDVVRRDHAEVAVARLARMHEIGGRAGRGEGRGDLAADMAGLAHAGDDQAAACACADQFDRGDERLRRARRGSPRPAPRCRRPRSRACAAPRRSAGSCVGPAFPASRSAIR